MLEKIQQLYRSLDDGLALILLNIILFTITSIFIYYSVGFLFLVQAMILPFKFIVMFINSFDPLMWLLFIHAAISTQISIIRQKTHILQILGLMANILLTLLTTPLSSSYLFTLVAYAVASIALSFVYPVINLFNIIVFTILSVLPNFTMTPFSLLFQALYTSSTLHTLLDRHSDYDSLIFSSTTIICIQVFSALMSVFTGPIFLPITQTLSSILLLYMFFEAKHDLITQASLITLFTCFFPYALLLTPLVSFPFVTILTSSIIPLVQLALITGLNTYWVITNPNTAPIGDIAFKNIFNPDVKPNFLKSSRETVTNCHP